MQGTKWIRLKNIVSNPTDPKHFISCEWEITKFLVKKIVNVAGLFSI